MQSCVFGKDTFTERCKLKCNKVRVSSFKPYAYHIQIKLFNSLLFAGTYAKGRFTLKSSPTREWIKRNLKSIKVGIANPN